MMSDSQDTMPTLFTIGAFGYDEASFFEALVDAQIDTFCDVRQRRGVRGATYAFVNSKRLQARLEALDIRYVHVKALAPTTAVRDAQKRADQAAGVAKRQRDALSPAFVEAYERACLADTEPADILAALPTDAERVALFCVEEKPSACHRSLAAAWLAAGRPVTHLVP